MGIRGVMVCVPWVATGAFWWWGYGPGQWVPNPWECSGRQSYTVAYTFGGKRNGGVGTGLGLPVCWGFQPPGMTRNF